MSRRTLDRQAEQVASSRWTLPAVAAATLLYVASALAAMLLLSPRVPYADVWRFVHRMLSQPFPASILGSDNGHREVLPNVVRYFELQVLSGSQQLQIIVGLTLLLATLGCWWRTLRRSQLPMATCVSAFLCIVIGLCWLGNFRALVHGNESVHAYLVTLFLALGVGCLVRPDAGGASAVRRGLKAGAFGLLATLSFGSGISSFAAFFVVLALVRAPPKQWLLVSVFLLLAASLVIGSGDTLELRPLLQSEVLLRWLSAPWVYASWPLLDAEIARLMPAPLPQFILPVSVQMAEAFGPVMTARWPHLLLGVAGAAWLLHTTWRCSRRNECAPALAGVALAWFSFAVGGLIAIARLAYFLDHPDQVLAPRYVVWSSLFWAGLAFATVVLASRPARASLAILAVAVALLPSQAWMWKLATGIRAVAEPAAVAAAVGVFDPEFAGENVSLEVATAIPSLRNAGAAMFAWEETRWLGQKIDGNSLRFASAEILTISAIEDPAAPGARRLHMKLPASQSGDRFLLLDSSGVVRGMAVRDRRDRTQALGWTQGPSEETPRLATLRQ